MVAKFSKIWKKFSDKKSRKQALNNPTNNDRQEAPRDATSPPAAPTNPEVTFNEDSDSLRRAIASPLFKAEPVNGEIAAINLERSRENESERPEENEIAPETAAGEITAYDVSDEYASSDTAKSDKQTHLPTDVSASQSIRIVTPIQGVYLVSSPTTHMMITKTESSTPATKMMLLTLMSLQMFIEHMAFVLEWMVDRPIGIPLGSWLRNYLGPLSY
ncbi:5807_t:CDS:2 [Paraglomus occultum]|uniref:5807_t:CDS:1 n=1 Tax=Paraglomus occultum TaxID=144539 RepID=A0A9N9A454_9GLOM|nr:5807_t:CDS:2 [Paraglomus occultum]